MQPRSHPFFSRLGCAVALFLAVGLGLTVWLQGGIPFSPGRLAAAEAPASSLAESEFANHAAFEADCERCHVPWRGIDPARCEECHQDVSQQRAGSPGIHRYFVQPERCTLCHTDHRGTSATLTTVSPEGFDHSLTPFSLVQHEFDYDGDSLTCHDCHTSGGFTMATADCTTCHTAAEPAFVADHTALFGPECAECHDGLDTMTTFEHEAVFTLDGAHTTVACATCHQNQTFAGTPATCEGCHEEPGVHAGLFGLDCARCHTTTAWRPAELTRHTFPLDHGTSGKVACQTCHEATYAVYTCYICHEHNPTEIAEEHREEGILEFANCVDCHPTGREEEAEDD